MLLLLWAATKELVEVVSCKKLSANVIWFRGAQIQCSRSHGRLHFVRRRLIFVRPQLVTCFVSHFCRLRFWGGCYICGKLVDFWSNLLIDISSYVVWNAWPCVVDKKFTYLNTKHHAHWESRTWGASLFGRKARQHNTVSVCLRVFVPLRDLLCVCVWGGGTRDSLQMFSNSLFLHLQRCNRKQSSRAHRHVFRLA